MKDVQATVTSINNALATRTEALAEQGADFEEVVLMLAQEKALLEENGIEQVSQQLNPKMQEEEKTSD